MLSLPRPRSVDRIVGRFSDLFLRNTGFEINCALVGWFNCHNNTTCKNINRIEDFPEIQHLSANI